MGDVEFTAASRFGAYFDGQFTFNGSQTFSNVSDAVDIVQDEFDADAIAFLTATGIADMATQSAINTLVLDLKAANLWAKMQAIYPMAGGTASTHKYNLKNPVDSDSAFRLVFAGGWTHSSTGALGNGVNGYADTKFIPETHGVSVSSLHISYYSRQNTSGAYIEMGVAGNSGLGASAGQLYIAPNVSGTNYRAVNQTGNQASAGINTQGYFIATRSNSTNQQLYKNGSLQFNEAGTPNTAANYAIFLGRNNNGTADTYSNRECAFATIGEGLDATEAANLYSIIQTFNTSLGRQV